MIPKIIHCIWLSGEKKDEVYETCISTWKKHMPEYEIIEWNLEKFPANSVPWVQDAVACKKWAYAADYIRLYALYNYGGIYLDMDVCVYKSFDPFLSHRAFSCVEFDPRPFYSTIYKREVIGCGFEAAVIGAEKGHPWIKACLDHYKDKHFINNPDFYFNHVMPRIITKITHKAFGFKYVPIEQTLKQGIHIYPPDTFSSIYNFSRLTNLECNLNNIIKYGEKNPIRYAFHLCNHGWWERNRKEKIFYKIKLIYDNIVKKLVPSKRRIFRDGRI